MAGIRGINELIMVVDHIEANPETWGQGAWACGTAFCVGGHICLADGARPEHELVQPWYQSAGYDSLGAYMDDILGSEWNTYSPEEVLWNALEIDNIEVSELQWPDGSIRHIESEARRILGIDQETANLLFNGYNSLERIKAITEHLKTHDSISGFYDSETRTTYA